MDMAISLGFVRVVLSITAAVMSEIVWRYVHGMGSPRH